MPSGVIEREFMKFLFGFIIIIIIGSLTYFFTQTKNPKVNDELTTIDQLNQKQLETKNDPQIIKTKISGASSKDLTKSAQTDDPSDTQADELQVTDSPERNDTPQEDDDFEGMDSSDETPEYSEEVSGEDFKEFIGIALEELEAGDELAEAIITEMVKIAEAQPDHLDQVKYFYRACADKANISNDNQQLCLKLLEKINEPSN